MIVSTAIVLRATNRPNIRRTTAAVPRRGALALRSPRRPNPIGITIVELLAVSDNVLRVRGLDAINGTPVLDIKPA